jgi:CPA1 family monovalent cation:H+ antiporter
VLEIRSGGTVASGGNSHRGEECADLEQYPPTETQSEPVCDACLREGMRWVAMRQCLVCGNVACCDSSLGQHATAHFHETGHPVMESAEPGEDWRWCFVRHQRLTGVRRQSPV